LVKLTVNKQSQNGYILSGPSAGALVFYAPEGNASTISSKDFYPITQAQADSAIVANGIESSLNANLNYVYWSVGASGTTDPDYTFTLGAKNYAYEPATKTLTQVPNGYEP